MCSPKCEDAITRRVHPTSWSNFVDRNLPGTTSILLRIARYIRSKAMCRKVIRSICTNHRRVYHETQTLYTLEDFAVLDTLYLAFHAIYRVAAVQLVRNYGILQQNMIITPRNFAFLPASRLREMEKKANVAVSRDASRSIVRSDTSEMQERGFILDCCLRPIVTSKSRVGGILINRKLIVCECSSVVHE